MLQNATFEVQNAFLIFVIREGVCFVVSRAKSIGFLNREWATAILDSKLGHIYRNTNVYKGVVWTSKTCINKNKMVYN